MVQVSGFGWLTVSVLPSSENVTVSEQVLVSSANATLATIGWLDTAMPLEGVTLSDELYALTEDERNMAKADTISVSLYTETAVMVTLTIVPAA